MLKHSRSYLRCEITALAHARTSSLTPRALDAQAGAVLPPPPVDVRAPLRGADSLRAARLAAVGRAWAAARFFHPWLADGSIDWDSALVRALPAIRAAATRAEYARAVQSLFASLGDPVTRVTARARPTGTPAPSTNEKGSDLAHALDDSTLLVSVRDPDQILDLEQFATRVRVLAPRLLAAHRVVVDLRVIPEAQHPEMLSYGMYDLGLGALLISSPIRPPAERLREWIGYPPDAQGAAESYHAGWRIVEDRLLEPLPHAQQKRIAFVVNARTQLPPLAAALRDAGEAIVVSDGSAAVAGMVVTTQLALDDSTRLELRTSDLLWGDGRVGFVPDTVVADPGEQRDVALDVALRWVRDTATLALLQLPHATLAIAPPRARAYPEMRNPTVEWRLLAAYRIWGTMEYFHAYRHLYDDDWYAVLEHLIPRFESATDSMGYGWAVAEMVHHVHDSHAAVIGSAPRSAIGSARPAIRTRLLGDTLVITAVVVDSVARQSGLRAGDVIASVDGVSPRAYVTRVTHTLSSSNAWTRDRDLGSRLLLGPNGSQITLLVQGADGRRRTVTLTRMNAYVPFVNAPPRSGPVWCSLEPDIGYIDLDRATPAQADSALDALARARVIVFDLRGYPDGTLWSMAPRLGDRPQFEVGWFGEPRPSQPRHRPEDALQGDASLAENETATLVQTLSGGAANSRAWRGHAVVMIDEGTQSQAEHTTLGIVSALPGTRVVGSPSAGANGDVSNFVLPGNITVYFSGHDVRWPDGRQLQRVGITPDVLVRPTVRGIRAGRDEVLEAAVAMAQRTPPSHLPIRIPPAFQSVPADARSPRPPSHSRADFACPDTRSGSPSWRC
jgi:C-terminal processing protease CtpA/Prc